MLKKYLPALLILMGIAMFITFFVYLESPVLIAPVLGVLFIGWGVKLLMAERKK
mgnify:CR=1 FL=1